MRALAVVGFGLLLLLLLANVTCGRLVEVTAAGDDPLAGCTLREAIRAAIDDDSTRNCTILTSSGTPTVTFADYSAGDILLEDMPIQLNGAINIVGLTPNGAPVSVQAPLNQPAFAAIPESTASVLIANVTLRGHGTVSSSIFDVIGQQTIENRVGLMYAQGFSSLDLHSCTFENGRVNGKRGQVAVGAIRALNVESVVVENCVFSNNAVLTGQFTAGALSVEGQDFDGTGSYSATLKRTEFSGNNVTATNGAISALYLSRALGAVEACVFTENSAMRQLTATALEYDGGAFGTFDEHATLTNCLFEDNLSHGGGAALTLRFSEITFECEDNLSFTSECGFVGNTGGLDARSEGGGAIFIRRDASLRLDCTDTFVPCAFRNNVAVVGGGGLAFIDANSVTLEPSIQLDCPTSFPCIIEGNVAPSTGKGGAFFVSSASDLAISGDVTFSANSAGFGGAIGNIGGNIIFAGEAVFERNSASSGAAVNLDGNGSTMDCNGLCSFTNNTASFFGGGISAIAGSISLTGQYAFALNSASIGGGFSFTDTTFGTLTMSGSYDFESNGASTGGGMFVSGISSLAGALRFSGNTALSGGGLYLNGRRQDFLGEVEFVGNRAPLGGGVFVASEIATFGNVNFTENLALKLLPDDDPGSGGAIYVDGGSNVTITNSFADLTSCLFHGNEADIGGAVHGDDGFLRVVGGCSLTSNRATELGGAVYVTNGGSFAIDGPLSATTNTADEGGAFYAGSDAVLAMSCFSSLFPSSTSCDLSENSATSSGGMAHLSMGTLLLRGPVLIDRNEAGMGGGGAIFAEGGGMSCKNCSGSISDNTSDRDGGAIAAINSSVTLEAISRIAVDGNVAQRVGGAIAVKSSFLQLQGPLMFFNNEAGPAGGAVYVNETQLFSMSGGLQGAPTYKGNSASGGGGGAIRADDSSVVIDCEGPGPCFDDNSAKDGGAIFMPASVQPTSLTLTCIGTGPLSCSIEDNTALSGSGGAIYYSKTIMLNGNFSFARNRAGSGGAIFADMPTVPFSITSGEVTFRDNEALSGDGGGLYVGLNVPMILMSGARATFIRNEAAGNGGGAFVKDVQGLVSFTGNMAGQTGALTASFGGGLYCASFTGTIDDLSGNSAVLGGGLYSETFVTTTILGDIVGNSASVLGGAIRTIADGDILLPSGSIIGNTASEGGFFSCSNTGCYLTLTLEGEGGTASISENEASMVGGLAKVEGAFTLQACTSPLCSTVAISDNTALSGGAVSFSDSLLLNSTKLDIVGNIGCLNCTAQASEGVGAFMTLDGGIIASVRDVRDNVAVAGAAFGSIGEIALSVVGEVSGNRALGGEGSLAIIHDKDLSVVLEGTADIKENEGYLIVSHLDQITFSTNVTIGARSVSDNEGLVLGDGSIYVSCLGTEFLHNTATLVKSVRDSATIDGAGLLEGNVGVDEPAILSGRDCYLRNHAGDIRDQGVLLLTQVTVSSIMLCTQDCFWTGSAPFTVSDNEVEGGLVRATRHTVVDGHMFFVDHSRGSRALFIGFGDINMTIPDGHFRHNRVPILGGSQFVDLTVGDISSNHVEQSPYVLADFSLFLVTSGTVMTVRSGSICDNTVEGSGVSPLVSILDQAGPSAPISITFETGPNGSFEGNKNTLFPSVPMVMPHPDVTFCYISTLVFADNNPLGDCVLDSPLPVGDPIFIAPGLVEATVGEPLNVSVGLTFAADQIDRSGIQIGFRALIVSFDGEVGEDFQPTNTSGIASFEVDIDNPNSETGTALVEYFLPLVCRGASFRQTIVFSLPRPTPSRTPAPDPSPSLSATISTSKSITPTRSPSRSAGPSRTSSPSATISHSPTRSKVGSASPLFTVLASGTRSIQKVSVAAPPVILSASRTRSKAQPSPSRTPSASKIPLPSFACLNCVVPTTAPVNPLLVGSPAAPDVLVITNEEGRPVGSVTIPAATERETIVVGPASREAEIAARNLDVASSVVDISLIDARGATVQPQEDVEVCLEVEDRDRAEDEGCLSFFDEEENRWVCEDRCLEFDGNTACGTTDHFTNFAVLFDGGGGGGDRCGSSASGQYILGEAWKDAVLVISVFCAVCCCCCLIVVFALLFPNVMSRIHGKEYHRIDSLRRTSHDKTSSA